MNRNYIIGSGFHRGSPADGDFVSMWVSNVNKTTSPRAVVVMSTAGIHPSYSNLNTRLIGIDCQCNLGHVGQLLSSEKNHQLCGWSASFIALASISYNMGTDFLFIEQDCLAFGPYVERMYQDMGDGSMVFGAKMKSQPWMASAQSLVLVRHDYILTMVRNYIDQGWDRRESLPEDKFAWLEHMDPARVRRLSFGYDRERPICFDDPVFYGQKFNEEELKELRGRGFI